MPDLPTLVLASGSPRRLFLLSTLGLQPVVRPADVDETRGAGEAPAAYVRRLARAKARAEAHAGELVLAADTAVVLGEAVLGKPTGAEEAVTMLCRLAGREHRVLTGVALFDAATGGLADRVTETAVTIAPLTEAEARRYVASGEPLDKAGAYALQGRGGLFVERIAGDYGTVVGLPLAVLPGLFAELGFELERFLAAADAASLSPRP